MPDELPQAGPPTLEAPVPTPGGGELFKEPSLPQPDTAAITAATTTPPSDFISSGAEGKFDIPEPKFSDADIAEASAGPLAETPLADAALNGIGKAESDIASTTGDSAEDGSDSSQTIEARARFGKLRGAVDKVKGRLQGDNAQGYISGLSTEDAARLGQQSPDFVAKNAATEASSIEPPKAPEASPTPPPATEIESDSAPSTPAENADSAVSDESQQGNRLTRFLKGEGVKPYANLDSSDATRAGENSPEAVARRTAAGGEIATPSTSGIEGTTEGQTVDTASPDVADVAEQADTSTEPPSEDADETTTPEAETAAPDDNEGTPPQEPPAPPSPEPGDPNSDDDGNEVRNDGVPQGSTWEGRTKKQQNADRSPDGDPQTNTKLDLRTEGTGPSANDGTPEMPASSDGGDQPPEEPPAPDATPPGEEPDPAGPLHEAMGDHTDDEGRQEEQAAGSAPLDLDERSAQIDQEMREGADQGRAILEQPPAPRESDEPITNDTDLQQLSDEALDAEINKLEGIQDRDLTPEEANQLMRLQDERDKRIEFGERTFSPEDMTSDEIEAEIADLEGLDNPSEENSARLEELRAAREDRQANTEQREPTDPFRSKLEEDRTRKQEIIDAYRAGEDLTEDQMNVIYADLRRNESIQDKLDNGEELNAYEADLAERYGLTARERPAPGNERDNRIRELEGAIQRGDATPEQRREYMNMRAEADQEKKDVKERDILRDKLITEGSLSDEEQNRLDELEGKLQNRELTPEERGKEVDRLATKMAEDMMNGRDIDEGDLERFRTLKAEQALDQAGVESGRKAIMGQIKENLANKRLREKKETAVEKKTKEKLAELMNLEMQMLAIPRQLEALAQSQKNLKRDIERKKAEVGRFSNKQEAQNKRRTELYPLMMALAQNKGLIGHYKNHSLVLRAAYKGAMADLNRTLKLNGRFGIVQDVFQHIDAMISRAYADIKTDYDSIYASDAKDAQKAA